MRDLQASDAKAGSHLQRQLHSVAPVARAPLPLPHVHGSCPGQALLFLASNLPGLVMLWNHSGAQSDKDRINPMAMTPGNSKDVCNAVAGLSSRPRAQLNQQARNDSMNHRDVSAGMNCVVYRSTRLWQRVPKAGEVSSRPHSTAALSDGHCLHAVCMPVIVS